VSLTCRIPRDKFFVVAVISSICDDSSFRDSCNDATSFSRFCCS